MKPLSADRPRLLCVDDEPQLLAGLSDILRFRFTVVTATSPQAGLTLLRDRGPFAVVISDFRMPEMNGAEFLRQAREVAPDTVRILLTGQATPENAVAAVNEGHIFRMLMKPCAPPELLRAVEEAMDLRQSVIAERQARQEQVECLSGHLRRADRLATLGTMASAVGHEINNLLMGVAGARSLIEMDRHAGRPPRQSALSLMADAETQLGAHARNLLELGRPVRSDTETTDLESTIGAVAETLRTAGIVRGSILQTTLPGEPIRVCAARSALQQVLVNLIKNAVEAFGVPMPSTARIHVSVTADARTGTATMTVADNAAGIAADELPFVFEPYYTSKSPECGTGLGLFVVRQIVADAGGEITVESQKGRGTTFTVKLPLAHATSSQPLDAAAKY